ncbi:ATP synthase F1, delta subunit [Enterococcus columbae DSM 7374 = ATCC 51263]|nr:ATP synthase F1, delta subunit [Enterococcus columbae DSM 7374 = ATCC 51263]
MAVENDCLAQTHQELLQLKEIYAELPELGQLLNDVRLEPQQKQAIVSLLAQNCSKLVKDAIYVIYENSRMAELAYIVEAFCSLYNEKLAILDGTITTAIALTPEQKARLEEKILKKFGYQTAKFVEKIDPSIIGGIIVEANHQIIDGSLKTKLATLKASLL